MGKVSLSCYLLRKENRGYVKFCSLFTVETLHPPGIKLRIEDFIGVLLMSSMLV